MRTTKHCLLFFSILTFSILASFIFFSSPGICESGCTIKGRITGVNHPGGITSGVVYACEINTGYTYEAGGAILDGYYELSLPVAGDWKINVAPDTNWIPYSEYLSEWYNNKDSYETADIIHINEGQTISGIDFLLDTEGSISGKITSVIEPGGVENVYVYAYDDEYRLLSRAITDAAGNYTLGSLVSSKYKLRFDTQRCENGYLEEWYNNKSSFSDANATEAERGTALTGYNVSLAEAGSKDNRLKAVVMLGSGLDDADGSVYTNYYERCASSADYLEDMGFVVERFFAFPNEDPPIDKQLVLDGMDRAKILVYAGHGGYDGFYLYGGIGYEELAAVEFAENPVAVFSGACFTAGDYEDVDPPDDEVKYNVAVNASTFMGWCRRGDFDDDHTIDDFMIDYTKKNLGFSLYYANNSGISSFLQQLLSNQDYRLDELIDEGYTEDPYRYNDESSTANPMKENYQMLLPQDMGNIALVANMNLTTKDIIPAIPAPAIPAGYGTTYYFAEGCTRSFQEYLTLGNPNPAPANVQVLYMFPTGDWQTEQVTVLANSRSTIDVNSSVGYDHDVSVRIASDQAIVAERPMYFDYNGLTGGSDVLGATSPGTTWYFAEGYTGPGFDEWVCVLNPGDTAADLTFRFQTQEAGEIVKTGFNVAPHSRATFKANDLLDGVTYQTSLKLESSQPVVAERPMYFSYSGNGGWDWTGGHCVMGSPSPSKSFFFAEGTTRGGFEQWLTLQNPGSEAITVDAVYQLGAGQGDNVTRKYTIGAGQRATVFVENEVGAEKDVSVKLTSSSDFLAERPMYFNYQNVWTGGHCVIGATSPQAEWFLAEGYTGSGFDEYICLQNPGDTEATVQITYLTQEAGALAPKEIKVPARSRSTVLVNTDAGADYQLSVKLEVIAGDNIVVERPMYFDYRGWTGGHDVVGYTP